MSDPLSFTQVLEQTELLLLQYAQTPGIKAYKPHDKQIIFHQSESKEKLFIGGNRSGKTVGSVAEDIMWLTGEHPFRDNLPPPPVRGRIVAVDIEDGIKKIILPELAKWTPMSALKNHSWEDSYDKQSRTLTLENGSFVELMSYEQDVPKFAGTSRHFVHFDEEPPEDIFNECLMRLVDTDGSYWIAMTPLIEMTWVDKRIIEPWKEGDNSILVIEVNTDENPHVKQGAMDRLTRGLSDEERETRRTGKIISHTGQIFAGHFSARDAEDGGNIYPDILQDFDEYRNRWGHFVCMDSGYANPTVFLFCCFNGNEDIIVYDEIYLQRHSVSQLSQIFLQRCETVGVYPVYRVGDPSIRNTNAITQTSVQTEYAEHGVPIALGNNDVRAGILRMQNRFEARKLFISIRCKETLKEIPNYRWDRFASAKIAARRNKKEMPIKKDDHCMDALRYGVMSRPVLEGEEEVKFGNVFGAIEAKDPNLDYELLFPNQEEKFFDEQLGIDW